MFFLFCLYNSFVRYKVIYFLECIVLYQLVYSCFIIILLLQNVSPFVFRAFVLVSQNNVIITNYILAILGSDKVCEYLLRLEVPVATYTTYGSTPMEQILLNVPDVAEEALDQYIFRSEQINSKLYYINCLTTRRWQQLSTLKKKQRERRMYPTVLEVDSSCTFERPV